MKKIIAILLVAVLAFGLLAGCGKSGGSHPVCNTYTESIDLMIKLLAGKSFSQTEVKKMQLEKFFAYEVSFEEYYSNVKQQSKINENSMIAAFGKNYTVSYEIVSQRELSAEERYEATKHLNGEVWYDATALGEVLELKLKVSFAGENLTKDFDMVIKTMKCGSGWYTVDIEYAEMMEFFGW